MIYRFPFDILTWFELSLSKKEIPSTEANELWGLLLIFQIPNPNHLMESKGIIDESMEVLALQNDSVLDDSVWLLCDCINCHTQPYYARFQMDHDMIIIIISRSHVLRYLFVHRTIGH